MIIHLIENNPFEGGPGIGVSFLSRLKCNFAWRRSQKEVGSRTDGRLQNPDLRRESPARKQTCAAKGGGPAPGSLISYNRLGLPAKNSATGGSVLAKYSYLSDGMKTGAFKADGSGFIYRGSLKYALSRTSRCPTPTSEPGTTARPSAAGSPPTPSPRSTTPPAHTPTAPEIPSTLWIRMEGRFFLFHIVWVLLSRRVWLII